MGKKKMGFVIFCTAEVITAAVYAWWIAPSLAAMHNDMHVDLPMLLFLVSAFALLFMSAFSFGYVMIRKFRGRGAVEWKAVIPLLGILASIVIWAYVLFVIGCNTDCCPGG